MRKELPVSIIIPTFNRHQALCRTLAVIESQSKTIPQEIIVVDQSMDVQVRLAIQESCAEFRSINVRYVFLETPSTTKARNVGIQQASNDILVFMDDDVDVNPDSLENIYTLMSQMSTAMVGVIDETLPTSGGVFGCIFAMKSYRNRNIGHVTKALLGRYPQKVEGTVDTMWAMGFCFAVKKKYLTDWDISFDEKLTGYAYAEDLDLTYRYYKKSRKAGLRCLLSENITVKHLETKEYRIPSKRNIFKYVINRKYLAYKYGEPMPTHLVLAWANTVLLISRLLHHEPCKDILEANRRCRQVKKYLKQGIIQEEFFDEEFSFTDNGRK